MNVDVEKTDPQAAGRQCHGEVDSHRALADASFAGKNNDLVTDARDALLEAKLGRID
jgi:hypothetical protein